MWSIHLENHAILSQFLPDLHLGTTYPLAIILENDEQSKTAINSYFVFIVFLPKVSKIEYNYALVKDYTCKDSAFNSPYFMPPSP